MEKGCGCKSESDIDDRDPLPRASQRRESYCRGEFAPSARPARPLPGRRAGGNHRTTAVGGTVPCAGRADAFLGTAVPRRLKGASQMVGGILRASLADVATPETDAVAPGLLGVVEGD